MKRHIGKIINTDQRVVVVFMQIPGREDHALVVSTDNLPPRFEQYLMEVVESPEGQQDPTLANVLGRRLMPDSTNTVLQAMHDTGYMRAVHIDQVMMYPMPNMPFPLRRIIESNNGSIPASTAVPAAAKAQTAEDKYNQHADNLAAYSADERANIARNLLVEADLLQSDADRKRAMAYRYAPELEPTKKAKLTSPEPNKAIADSKTEKPAKSRRVAKKAG